jgi:phospholipid/cholesterol/gamma-HCH transport system ATP-binding protein
MHAFDHRRTVLNVDRMTLFAEGEASGDYTTAHFDLLSGQLALVRIKNLLQAASLADAFCGLVRPTKGRVRFFGRDWRKTSADATNAMRGKIGRVFSSGSWLDDLSLADNIVLSQLHHTRKPKQQIWQEATRLAIQFGLPGLPTGLPGDHMLADCRRAACVRAFLGTSSLLLLEDPTFGLYPGIMAPLVNAARRVRDRGAAVFWMTLSDEVWQDESIPADRRFRVSGRELMEVTGDR